MERWALHDERTGCGTRRRFEVLLEPALSEPGGASPAVLMVGIDNMNDINEIAGYATGDAVLRRSAGASVTRSPPSASLERPVTSSCSSWTPRRLPSRWAPPTGCAACSDSSSTSTGARSASGHRWASLCPDGRPRVAFDDFGTGHSSLGALRRFPVDVLKIDRSFVAGLGVGPEDRAVVDVIVALAHILGFSVVAEGSRPARSSSS